MQFGNVENNVVETTATPVGAPEPTVALVKQEHETAIVEVQNSLASSRDRVRESIIASGEAKRISDQLAVNNPQSIVEFGKPVAEQMSKVADEVLRHTNNGALNDTGRMMTALAKIMDKVDIEEIKESDQTGGFFSKVLGNAQKKLDQFLSKYQSIGNEIEKICIELRTYESQIQKSNKDLEALYVSGVESYQLLMKYTMAGEMAIEELDRYQAEIQARAATDPTVQLELNNLSQARQLLEQRIMDLRLAESVALQSLPTLKALEFGNLNLDRKINSAFIVTLPVFKNAIAQAVIIKQQALQAKSMEALDKRTNEMLLKNSQNTANQMRRTATLAGSSAIDVDTIEKSWHNIMDGIRDTKQIQEELSKQRELDKAKIEQINQTYLSQVN